MLESLIDELRSVRRAIVQLTQNPTATQSVSSANGGSYSASFVDLDKLTRREAELVTRIAELHRAQEGGCGFGISYPIYCGG